MAERHIPWPVGTVLALPLLAGRGGGSTVGEAYAIPITIQDAEEGAAEGLRHVVHRRAGQRPRAGTSQATDGY